MKCEGRKRGRRRTIERDILRVVAEAILYNRLLMQREAQGIATAMPTINRDAIQKKEGECFQYRPHRYILT